MRPVPLIVCAQLVCLPAFAGGFSFASIDGGRIDLADWAGKPGLVINTASLSHPFYAWVAGEVGFTPAWNFNKVLLAPDGSVAGSWGSATAPDGPPIAGQIEAMLR